MNKELVISRVEANELYKHFYKNDESQMFFDELIDRGVDYVELVWNTGKIKVKAIIEGDLVEYEFNPYDSY